MKREWEKSHVLSIILGWFFLTAIILFVLLSHTRLTGLTIYENQPDSTTGADTYIREGSDSNYGTAATIKIGKTAAAAEYRGLINIDTSAISSTDTVMDAKLQVYLSIASNNDSMTIKVYRVTSNWNQTEAGWNNRTSTQTWSLGGGDYLEELDSINFNDTLGYYNFTITSAMRNWVNGSYNNYGLIIISEGAISGDTKEFSSSDEAISAQRPKIIVEHIPNAAPTIEGISTNSNLTSPKQ
ncbi:MAG: DNRLRE domain-containing protein, partial [Nanoarchaeota archaeon]|nr:DNRLRE domain-containing protein [Nanoarchaeota archaeon]